MLISLDMYSELVEKASKLEELLDHIEEERLLKLAESRNTNASQSEFLDNDTVCKELGIDINELEKDYENVEIE